MIVIGLLHGVLLWPGDIVGAYGLLALLMAGLLVRGSDRALLATGLIGMLLVTLLYAGSAPAAAGDPQALLPSMTVPDAGPALAARSRRVARHRACSSRPSGCSRRSRSAPWAARRRLLDEPDRHRARAAPDGRGRSAAAVLGGLPLALITAGLWASPRCRCCCWPAALHAISGYAGGLGYAALFGLLAIRIAGRGRPGAGRPRGAGLRAAVAVLLPRAVGGLRAAAAGVDARAGARTPGCGRPRWSGSGSGW